jgi:uncharacterized protein (DUF2249 family)
MKMNALTLDVSLLAPPEPMKQVLSALASLPSNHYVKMIHRREPFPLYQTLSENGWRFFTKQLNDEPRFAIYICREQEYQAMLAQLAREGD